MPQSQTEHTDTDLIRLFKSGQKEYAFEKIVRAYQEKLYWHIRKIVISHDDADDIIQNTFLKAWKALDEFREESHLYTWLYRIATNESLSLLKKNKRHQLIAIESDDYNLESLIESDSYFSGDDVQKKFQKALLKLPEKQRIVFNMKYFDEMKYEQMAKILKTSVGALKASYHHAVKKIENLLEKD